MSATIKYKGNTIASISTDSSKTLKTSGKYCEGDIVVENVQDGGSTEPYAKIITGTHTPAKNEKGITFLPDDNLVLRYFILQIGDYGESSPGPDIIRKMCVFRNFGRASLVAYSSNSYWTMPRVGGSNQELLVFPGNSNTTLYLGAGVTYNWIAVYSYV